MVNSKGRPPVEWGRGAVTEVPKVIVESCLDIHEGLTYKMRLIYFFFFFFSKTGCVKGAGVSSGLRALQSFTMTPFPKYPNEHHQSLTMLECHSLLRLLGLFLKLSLWHYGENYTFSTFWSLWCKQILAEMTPLSATRGLFNCWIQVHWAQSFCKLTMGLWVFTDITVFRQAQTVENSFLLQII